VWVGEVHLVCTELSFFFIVLYEIICGELIERKNDSYQKKKNTGKILSDG
jgi:hypothetical protein